MIPPTHLRRALCIWLGLGMLLLPHRSAAQSSDSLLLSERNALWVEALLADTGLIWIGAQPRVELEGVAIVFQCCLVEATARIDSLEQGNADAAQLRAAWANHKACTNQRDAVTETLVLPACHALLRQRLNPPRPAVLHFGVHNRMNCDVCIPIENLPIREKP